MNRVWESSGPRLHDSIQAFGTKDPSDSGVYKVPLRPCAHLVHIPHNLSTDTVTLTRDTLTRETDTLTRECTRVFRKKQGGSGNGAVDGSHRTYRPQLYNLPGFVKYRG